MLYPLHEAWQQVAATAARMVHFRSMSQIDLREVAWIDRRAFAQPLTVSQFGALLLPGMPRAKNIYCHVVASGHVPIGYVIHEHDGTTLIIQRLAVHPSYQRHGLGRAMVARIQERAAVSPGVQCVACVVPDQTAFLPAQCLLRACGFRAEWIVRDFACDGSADREMLFTWETGP